eukprot:1279100-Pyramimonas_sp.AAC.1
MVHEKLRRFERPPLPGKASHRIHGMSPSSTASGIKETMADARTESRIAAAFHGLSWNSLC